MKHAKDYSMLYAALAGFLIFALPICLLAGFIIWSNNTPSTLEVAFPEGTKIIEQSDTHQGLFRKEGVAIVVAKVPQEKIQSFGQQLQDEGFIEFPPLDHVREVLENVEAVAPILEAERVLWTYRDEAVAFVEEPFSDYFAAAYDMETGICCWVEYDS